MPMKNILNVPNPQLRLVSKPIKAIDSALIDFIQELKHTLIHKSNPAGVGLSAIQIGSPIRLFITYLPNNLSLSPSKWHPKNQEVQIYINPVILNTSKTVCLGENPTRPSLEGCLSIPRLYGPVWRYDWIEIQFQTIDISDPTHKLITKTQRFEAFPARVIQHEYDHLEGILFTDYLMGYSPAKNFHPLGKIDQLYLEEDNDLIPLKNPLALIKW